MNKHVYSVCTCKKHCFYLCDLNCIYEWSLIFLQHSKDSEIKVRGTILEGDKSTELVLILWQMFLVLVQAQVMEWGPLLQLSLL